MADINHASLEECKIALDASDDLVAIVDSEHVYRMANRAFLQMRNASLEDVVGRHVKDVLGADDYAKVRPHLERCFAGHEVEYSLDLLYQGLGMRTMLVRYTPVRTPEKAGDGRVERVLSVIRDITPVREAEAVARRHETTYAKLFLESHAAMMMVDPVSGLVIDSNKACCEFYGRSIEELCLMPLGELEAPGSKGCSLLTSGGSSCPTHCRHIAAGGKERHVEIFTSPFAPGARPLLHLTIYDVTERLRQEERNAFLASIVDSTHDAVIGKDRGGFIRSWNRGAEEMFGYTEHEMFGRHIREIIPDELMEESRELMGAVLGGRTVDSHETRRVRKDEGEIDVSLIISPIRNGKGGIQGISTIARDISGRKRDERRMNMLAAIVQQAEDAFVVADNSGRVEYVNAAFSRLSGIDENSARGLLLQDVLQPAAEARGCDDWPGGLLSLQPWSGRLALTSMDGENGVFRARALSIASPDGERPIRVCILRDVRREESLELQLRQAQKMEALGTLASGIAHDFNNVLASIMVNAETAALLTSELPQILRDCLDDIHSSSRRGAELVRNILTFCRQGEQELRLLEMRPVVKEALKLLMSTLPGEVKLVTHIGGEGRMVLADPSQIHQLVMNLCLNAVQAMREGGELRVSLQPVKDEGSLALRVEDQGLGIAPEHLQRVCDPFFTTKSPGEGTGLGLSIVHGIVIGSGGTLDIESAPGAGTTVTATFPVHGGAASQPDVFVSPPLAGKGVVLIVDDDAGVLASLERGLGRLGYEALAARSGSEALAVFEQASGGVDLLLCDQAMPGMEGTRLARLLREQAPDLPLIFYTGDSGRLAPEELASLDPCAVLHKPLSIVEINETIRAFLSGKERA